MCRNIRIQFLSWTYLYVHNSQNVRHMCDSDKSVQTDKRLFSKIYLCRSLLKQEKYRSFIIWGREFQREREGEDLNSKSLTLKDSSVRSIGTYLRASAC